MAKTSTSRHPFVGRCYFNFLSFSLFSFSVGNCTFLRTNEQRMSSCFRDRKKKRETREKKKKTEKQKRRKKKKNSDKKSESSESLLILSNWPNVYSTRINWRMGITDETADRREETKFIQLRINVRYNPWKYYISKVSHCRRYSISITMINNSIY